MEKSTEIAYRIFQFATIFLLVSGFGIAKIWLGVIIILIMIPYWSITRHLQRKIYSWVSLVIFVGVAACGLLSNASSYLMVAGVSSALACWELEDQLPKSMISSIPSVTSSCEKYHLKILAIAISTGLIVAEAGLFLKLTLPFGLVFLAAVLVLFCIFQLFSLFKRN